MTRDQPNTVTLVHRCGQYHSFLDCVRNKIMPKTIQSYFKSASPTEKFPSSGATTPCPTQADTSFSSQAPEQKKYKITACNGRELSLGQPEKKNVKREATLEDLEEGLSYIASQ